MRRRPDLHWRRPAHAPGRRTRLPVASSVVELDEVVRRRKMVRHYSTRPVPSEVVDRLLGLAVRAPSAGFSQGVDLLVLEGPAQTGPFFEATCDREYLDAPQASNGVLRAPVIVLPLVDPGTYVSRYGEQDKAGSGLAGVPADEWPVPYWLVDSAFVVMLLLLAATEEGLGALFFRLHRDPGPLLSAWACRTESKSSGPSLLATRRQAS